MRLTTQSMDAAPCSRISQAVNEALRAPTKMKHIPQRERLCWARSITTGVFARQFCPHLPFEGGPARRTMSTMLLSVRL